MLRATPVIAVHEDDEAIDARVVEDALAFIDAFYSSADDAGEASTRTVTEGETTHALDYMSAALDDVYVNLVALNRHVAQVNLEPSLQLVSGSRATDVVHHIQQRLDLCRRLWLLQQCPRTRWLAPLEDVAVVGLLQRRLDEITMRVASRVSERPLLEQRQSIENVSAKYFDHTQSNIAMRFRTGRFIPFKLSILAKAIWSVLLDGTFSRPDYSPACVFEHRPEILAHFQEDLNVAEGVIALRRSPLPDGTILLCWTAVSAAPHAEVYHVENVVGDMEIHQFGWIRVGRILRGTSPSSRAYMESLSDFVVRPACGARERDQELDRRRCERFKTALLTISAKESTDNRQLLENRMLDLTLGTHDHGGGAR